jgi:methyltransferase
VVTRGAIGFGLLALVCLERCVELAVSARNARRTLGKGGIEVGRGHYPVMVAFHAAFLAACAVEPLVRPEPGWPLPATLAAALAVVLAQALRWWAVLTLGERWSTRVVVLPGAPPVTSGPYRLLRHPNYLAVVVELAALPLALGAWRTAILATLGNAALLAVRIPIEERAVYGAAPAGRAAREEPRAAAANAGPAALGGRGELGGRGS